MDVAGCTKMREHAICSVEQMMEFAGLHGTYAAQPAAKEGAIHTKRTQNCAPGAARLAGGSWHVATVRDKDCCIAAYPPKGPCVLVLACMLRVRAWPL